MFTHSVALEEVFNYNIQPIAGLRDVILLLDWVRVPPSGADAPNCKWAPVIDIWMG